MPEDYPVMSSGRCGGREAVGCLQDALLCAVVSPCACTAAINRARARDTLACPVASVCTTPAGLGVAWCVWLHGDSYTVPPMPCGHEGQGMSSGARCDVRIFFFFIIFPFKLYMWNY